MFSVLLASKSKFIHLAKLVAGILLVLSTVFENAESATNKNIQNPEKCYDCTYNFRSPASDQYCYKLAKGDTMKEENLKAAVFRELYVYCTTIRGEDGNGTTIYVRRKAEGGVKPSGTKCEQPQKSIMIDHPDVKIWSYCRCNHRSGCNDDELQPNTSNGIGNFFNGATPFMCFVFVIWGRYFVGT